MKKILVLLLCVCVSVLSAEAQYVRVNYDKKTVAAMAAAYATETATEAYYTEQVKDILDKYSAGGSGGGGHIPVEVPRPQGSYRPGHLERRHGKLLLSPHLPPRKCEDNAEDMGQWQVRCSIPRRLPCIGAVT